VSDGGAGQGTPATRGTPDADEPVPGRRPGPGAWVKAAFGIAVLVFGVLYVARHRDELFEDLGRMSWLALALALPLAALAQLAAMQAYRVVMADLGSPLPVSPAGRVYFVSQLGKYLPGSVWAVVALVSVAREYRVMRKTSVAAGVFCLVLSLATAFCLAAALLPAESRDTVGHFWYLGLLLPVLVAALHPRVVGTALDLALRLAGRQPMPRRMTYPGTLRAAGWQTLSWLVFGLHAWALVVGIGGRATAATLAVSIGGFALSYGVGPLFVVAPAGAGVRETALVLTLGSVAGGSAAALAVALVSRVALVLVDFAQAAAWTLVERRRRRPRTARPAPVTDMTAG
jgi:hypothetical protein